MCIGIMKHIKACLILKMNNDVDVTLANKAVRKRIWVNNHDYVCDFNLTLTRLCSGSGR